VVREDPFQVGAIVLTSVPDEKRHGLDSDGRRIAMKE